MRSSFSRCSVIAACLTLLDGCSDPSSNATAERGAAQGQGGDTGSGAARNGGGGGNGGASSSPAKVPSDDHSLPCSVSQVLRDHCVQCHASPPKFSAPMPLTSFGALTAPSVSDSSKKVWEQARVRVHDPKLPMPPASQARLSADELHTLDDWFMQGAPAGATACTDQAQVDAGASDGGAKGPSLPCQPNHRFLAHAEGSDAPFHVPANADNLYQCFQFKPPFTKNEQAIAWAPLIGDARVVHHYILYASTSPVAKDGALSSCSHSGKTFLTGWAPGQGSTVMREDVGLELPDDTQGLMLEVHYWNVKGYTDALDTTGVEMCTTTTPRPQTAGILTLGTNNINVAAGTKGYQASGKCGTLFTSSMPGPLNVIGSGPHMHGHGQKFRTELTHNGITTALVDIPAWDFNNQTTYRHEPSILVSPGDSLKTTCTYDNPGSDAVVFGENTENEMCFDFTMVYPLANVPSFSNSLPLRLCSDNLDPAKNP